MDARIITTGIIGTGGVARPQQDAPQQQPVRENDTQKQASQEKPRSNFMPSPEQLDMLVSDALEARANGVNHDRGAIINLVV